MGILWAGRGQDQSLTWRRDQHKFEVAVGSAGGATAEAMGVNIVLYLSLSD